MDGWMNYFILPLLTQLLHVIIHINILPYIRTLYTTVGWYICYLVRSSGIFPRSVGRSIRPITFSFGILIFGRFPVEVRETLSECLSLRLSHSHFWGGYPSGTG